MDSYPALFIRYRYYKMESEKRRLWNWVKKGSFYKTPNFEGKPKCINVETKRSTYEDVKG